MKISVCVETNYVPGSIKEGIIKMVLKKKRAIKDIVAVLGYLDFIALIIVGCMMDTAPVDTLIKALVVIAVVAIILKLLYDRLKILIDRDKRRIIRQFLR